MEGRLVRSIVPLGTLMLLAPPPDSASSGFHRHDVGREVFVAYGERPLFAAVGQVERRSEFEPVGLFGIFTDAGE